MRTCAWFGPAVLSLGVLAGCSQITLLRTRELRNVGYQVDSARVEVREAQKSIDELSLKQGGSSSQMRADLTTMISDLQKQIGRLHSDIDETQHRLSELGQKLDRLEQRKIVISGGAPSAVSDSSNIGPPAPYTAPSVKVVEGLDLEHIFTQGREDYIQGKYDLAYQGFKTLYERDVAGSFKEQSLYWMGECLWKGDRIPEALGIYARVLKEFPTGDKSCAARFKIGLIHNEKMDAGKRDQAWNELLNACPRTNEADRARELMKP